MVKVMSVQKRQLDFPTYAQAAQSVSKRGNMRKDTKYLVKKYLTNENVTNVS